MTKSQNAETLFMTYFLTVLDHHQICFPCCTQYRVFKNIITFACAETLIMTKIRLFSDLHQN